MSNGLEYTTLYGGGAVRGISYVGTIKAFEELGIISNTLGGSSVGSIFASLVAVGYNSNELKEIFSQVNFNLFRDISIGIGPIFAFSKGEVFLEWIRELIEKKFYGEDYKKGTNRAVTFNDLEKDLVIITTDLANFKCKEFSKCETPDYEIASAVRISCCMPGLMKPIEYNNTLLVDGDLQKSWPMWKLSKTLQNSSNRILELRLEGYYEENDISGVDYANAVYSCMTAYESGFIKEIYGDKDKFDYIILNTGDVVLVDFNINEEKRNELINIGYKQTIEYFQKILPEKKKRIYGCYKMLNNHLNNIIKFINISKILKAKGELGELYTDLFDCHELFDDADLKKITHFKNIFDKNIKFPALFGRVKLNNETLVMAELKKLNNDFSAKIKELSDYIKYIDNR